MSSAFCEFVFGNAFFLSVRKAVGTLNMLTADSIHYRFWLLLSYPFSVL